MTRCSGKNIFCVLVVNAAVCGLTLLIFGQHQEMELPRRPSVQRLFVDTANEIRFQQTSKHVTTPIIYVITPTYTRLVQKAELTRLSTVFKLVGDVHWIVVEDSNQTSPLVSNFLNETGMNSTNLFAVTPDIKAPKNVSGFIKPRGVLQRNAGLQWLRLNLDPDIHQGVVYFADDDNTYSPELFKEMRDTKMVSVWPVGLVGLLKYEAPIVRDGKVVDWQVYWHRKERRFAMDMAGFAVNLNLILKNPQAEFSHKSKVGHLETDFLHSLGVQLSDLEPKANMCTKVLVWHTRTEKPNIMNENKMKSRGYNKSDPLVEV